MKNKIKEKENIKAENWTKFRKKNKSKNQKKFSFKVA